MRDAVAMVRRETMEKQLSIYDLCPDIKKPSIWECMKSCANYGKVMDTFPLGGNRCQYGYSKEVHPVVQEIDENQEVKFYCKYYELK